MLGLRLIEKIQEQWIDQCDAFMDDLIDSNHIKYISDDLVHSIWVYFQIYSVRSIVMYLFYAFCIVSLVVYILLSQALYMPTWLRYVTSLAMIWYIPILKDHIAESQSNTFARVVCDELRKNKDQWST